MPGWRGQPGRRLGIAKQLKDEIADCPRILVLTGRADDRWLASWSRAEAAVRTRSTRSVGRRRGVAAARTRAITRGAD